MNPVVVGVLVALVVVVVVLATAMDGARRHLAERGAQPSTPEPERLPFRTVDSLFTPTERSFFGVLAVEAESMGLRVFAKVRLVDLFWIRNAAPERLSFLNRIQQKHVDFVLCDAERLAPVLAIELDDRSHQRPPRAERDAFVNRVFADAGLPLARFAVRNSYVCSEVRAQLKNRLGAESTPARPAQRAALAADTLGTAITPLAEHRSPATGTCPRCGSALVERTSRNNGQQFLACPGFPNCRYTEPLLARA